MTQEVVDVLRDCYEAMNRGDLEAVLNDYYHEEIAFIEPEGSPWAGTYLGHEGTREFLGRVVADLEDMRLDPEEFLDAGPDRVVVLSRILARVKRTGEPFDVKYCGIARIRDGKIIEFRTYRDTALAQRALTGL